MRYERVTDILRLALRLQGTRGGVTIDEITEEFGISRRTAERMRDAVETAFGPLLMVNRGGKRIHWRLQSTSLRGLAQISTEELAGLEFAIAHLKQSVPAERTAMLRELAVKLRGLRGTVNAMQFDDDVEALMQAEGLAMHPGPRPATEPGLLPLLRDAIHCRPQGEIRLRCEGVGRKSRQVVEPYGVLYGNRAYLVGRSDWSEEPRLWSLPNVSNAIASNESFKRDIDFDLKKYAERSFGAYQEPPIDVVLRFDADTAPDAASFSFHPSQTITENEDGSLTVRFSAGGLEEMCWHLVTWRTGVTVEQPARLRERLQRMCAELSEHHAVGPRVTG